MKFRKKISSSNSKRTFTKGALNIHPKNATGSPMRGGIRL